MISWIDHPAYEATRDGLIATFTRRSHVFRKLKRIMFLGGKAGSTRRKALQRYFTWHEPDTAIFRSEDVWAEISARTDLNSLQMEDQLAQVADILVIIVESEGTIAELGAFSSSEIHRRKLLPIVNSKYENDRSFIQTGPLSWVESESTFSPPIYVDFQRILGAAHEICDRLDRIPVKAGEQVENLAESPKHLLFLVCDLVAVIGPTPQAHVDFYLSEILHGPPELDTATLLSLAAAMGLLSTSPGPSDSIMYYRPLSDGRLASFTYLKKGIDLSAERGKHLGVLQKIDEARAAVDILGGT